MSADKDARIAEIKRKLAEQQAALDWFASLVGESKGVVGYHLNGALAEWDEFDLPQSGAEELDALLAKAKEEGRREAVPEGWQVVPKEPTDGMIVKFWGEITHGELEREAAKMAYKAMLSAAPKPEGE